MKIQIILLLCLLPLVLLATVDVQVEPGTGIKDVDDSKDFHFRYHNLSDDFHLSGPLKWAVRFDFQGGYPSADSASFNLHALRIYNPLSGSGTDLKLRLTLRDEVAITSYTGLVFYYPGTTIYSTTDLDGVPNGQDITLDGVPDSLKVAWLVIELQEPLAGRYLSASEGSGNNSYYYYGAPNTEEVNLWRSLNEAGFQCELRFGVIGSFNLLSPRLELVDFSLGDNLLPRQRVYPQCRVYNHSNIALNDSLRLEFTGPTGSGFTQVLTMPLSNLSSQDYSSYMYQDGLMLPESPMQFKLNIAFVQNPAYEVRSRYVNVFSDTLTCLISEHFLSSSSAMGSIPANTEQAHHLFYIPNQVDELSNLDAVERFNYYEFNTLPKSVVMGSKRFHLPLNNDSLQVAITAAQNIRSFISRGSCEISPADTVNIQNLNFTFALLNGNTDFDQWPQSFSPRFFAGIYEGNLVAGRLSYVIRHWLAFNSSVANLDQGDSFSAVASYNISELNPEKSYRVYYWLQDTIANGGQIYYVNWVELIRPVSVSDDYLVPPRLTAYPNPLRKGAILKTGSFNTPVRLSVYNLRGQLVFKSELTKGSIEIPSVIFPTSGIYFLRSEALSGFPNYKQTIRITVIK